MCGGLAADRFNTPKRTPELPVEPARLLWFYPDKSSLSMSLFARHRYGGRAGAVDREWCVSSVTVTPHTAYVRQQERHGTTSWRRFHVFPGFERVSYRTVGMETASSTSNSPSARQPIRATLDKLSIATSN